MAAKKQKIPTASWVFLALSVILLLATVHNVLTHGKTAYFALFHRPFSSSTPSSKNAAYKLPVLPTFKSQASISKTIVAEGDEQEINLSVTASQNIQGNLKVWIIGPANKQVFKSPADNPQQFIANKTTQFKFSYVLPAGLPKGDYRVSEIITSKDEYTDYYVNTDFATFKLL